MLPAPPEVRASSPLPRPKRQIATRLVSLGGEGTVGTAAQALAAALDELRGAPPRPDVLVRVEQRVAPADPLAWLAAQPDPVRLYWEDRDGEPCVGGVGVAVQHDGRELADLGTLELVADGDGPAPDARLLFSARFDPDRPPADEWARFGAVRCYLPAIELSRTTGGHRLACHVPQAPDELGRMARALRGLRPPVADDPPGPLADGRDRPMDRAWSRGVARVLDSIRRDALQKAVLARRARHRSGGELCPVRLLRALARDHPGTFRFCLQLTNDLAFVGASPELLYRRRGRDVASDALAGTRPRGGDRARDRQLAADLQASDKERREHGLVCDHIRARLAPLCDELRSTDAPEVHRMANVQHLVTRFEGRLAPGVGDAAVLARLHPTPAVGGLPVDAALLQIRACEDFDRGLYGGLVGCLERDAAHCAVAIRCGLVRGRELSTYAGAGIVEGSSAADEWAETASKLRAFAAVLGEKP